MQGTTKSLFRNVSVLYFSLFVAINYLMLLVTLLVTDYIQRSREVDGNELSDIHIIYIFLDYLHIYQIYIIYITYIIHILTLFKLFFRLFTLYACLFSF